MLMLVEIAEIDEARSAEANPRLSIDAETVERYAAVIDGLPPVTLHRVGGTLLVADGLHRIAAARQAGRETIDAEIIGGTEREWREAILLSNHQHGRPWSRAERRECVVCCRIRLTCLSGYLGTACRVLSQPARRCAHSAGGTSHENKFEPPAK